MTRFSRLFVSAVAALAISVPAPAQLLGGGDPGGAIGGVLGGLPGGIGGAVGNIGSTGGDAVGGVLGGIGNGGIGGIGGMGGMGGGLNGLSPGPLGGVLTQGQLREMIYPVTLDRVNHSLAVSTLGPETIADLRSARLKALIEANRATLDRDHKGQPVRRGELIVTNPDMVSLGAAMRTGFRVIRIEPVAELGIRLVALSLPRGMNVRQGIKALRRAAPALQADYNHIYEPAGGALLPAAGVAIAASRPVRGRVRIAMIDGGVASHPSLARASIEQRGFAGMAQPTGHGTAIGSLLVGDQGPFRGAARGAQLFVADVYGGNPAAGSVTSIVRGLAWAASRRPAVINVSLIGPPNRALAQAIAALRARGIAIVAAVGNDGPAAPASYPASYPGVIAITGVCSRGRALPEAGKSEHLDFAAPGADMAAALPGAGYAQVRGTSFAAPLAAARFALAGSYQRLAAEARPGKGRIGRGIVCAHCRVDPKVVRAR